MQPPNVIYAIIHPDNLTIVECKILEYEVAKLFTFYLQKYVLLCHI